MLEVNEVEAADFKSLDPCKEGGVGKERANRTCAFSRYCAGAHAERWAGERS